MIDSINSEYCDCISTLKDTSLDDSKNEFMVDSSLKVFDFDKIKEKYSKKFEVYDIPLSNDVLFYKKEDEIYFIEFKNGRIDQRENGRIKFKFLESILMFVDIVKKDLEFSRNNVKYILVYNYDVNCDQFNFNDDKKVKEVHYKNSRVNIGQALMRLAKKELVRFDLARYANIYVKEVHTYSIDEFKKNFLEIYDSNPISV